MKFAVTLALTLVVFLSGFELGYSRQSPLPQRPTGGMSNPEMLEPTNNGRDNPPRRQRPTPRRRPSPPRGRFENIPVNQRATLGNGLLAKNREGNFRPIDNTFRVVPSLDGFYTMVKDSTNFVSAIYYPGTFEEVQVHKDRRTDIRPMEPRLIPGEEYRQRWSVVPMEPFPY